MFLGTALCLVSLKLIWLVEEMNPETEYERSLWLFWGACVPILAIGIVLMAIGASTHVG